MQDQNRHRERCSCWRCTAALYGCWFDQLGTRTISRAWRFFVTTSFATPEFPWRRGFPTMPSRPNPEFTRNFFAYFVDHFENVLQERIDYAVADQLGDVSGRLHTHALLAGASLDDNLRRPVEAWLTNNAGYSRVLPFEREAAFYIARYIGRNSKLCEWDIRIGEQRMAQVREPQRWGEIVVASADLPKRAFHQGFPRRRR